MDIILNELSLSGQYLDLDDFANRGLIPVGEILKMILPDSGISILKNQNFYNTVVYQQTRLFEILHQQDRKRRSDRITQFKSLLTRFQNKPFWDDNQQHRSDYDYRVDNAGQSVSVTNCGLAEAYARNVPVISFIPSDYESESIEVVCKELDATKNIDNIRSYRHYLSVRYKNGEIEIDEYIRKAFANCLNFDEICAGNGLNLIDSDNLDIFIACFEKFEKKNWQSIITDKGLDYKQFNKNRNTKKFFDTEKWDIGVWKFRIDQEKRCFGHREGDIFYVWRIDLDHKLSDLG